MLSLLFWFFYQFKDYRKCCNQDKSSYNQTNIIFKLYPKNSSEKIIQIMSGKNQTERPHYRTDDIIQYKRSFVHSGNSCNYWGKGSEYRKETSKNNGSTSMFIKKLS